MKLMGFAGFDSTKGKGVEDNNRGPAKGAISKHKAREYRQYMNRRGAYFPVEVVAHVSNVDCGRRAGRLSSQWRYPLLYPDAITTHTLTKVQFSTNCIATSKYINDGTQV